MTAHMKASVTRTERLNMVNRPGSRFASMKASISGWSQRMAAIMAPRRDPALMMVRHMASHTSMNDRGPEASAPIPLTAAPLGRRVEKSYPMPPPCCMVSAASLRFSKIPDMSSGMSPMTKQLNKVTLRSDPAPDRMRPAGRKPKPSNSSKKRRSQWSRPRGVAALSSNGP